MPLTSTNIPSNPVAPCIASVTYYGDQLIAGDAKLITENITLAAGKLARGAVLGKVTLTGNYVLSVKTANDGSQVPSVVLADDADATAGPVVTSGYFAGEFAVNAMTMDASWTATPLRDAMRSFNIYLKTAMTAANPT